MTNFDEFLKMFVPLAAAKAKQLNKAIWLLETTGSTDAADLKADLDTEYRMLFNDAATYQKLLSWQTESLDASKSRQLNILIRAFKQNQVPKHLLEEMAQKEAALTTLYSNFRVQIDGKVLTENDIREVLKNEETPAVRKKAWEGSKEIGNVLAPQILELVRLRNESAKTLGYSDYFEMQLDLQEVKIDWLLTTFDDMAEKSDKAYSNILQQIEARQIERFKVSKEELGPWAWSEPFCQEDPLDTQELDALVHDVDTIQASVEFYKKMGIDISGILAKSDMFERQGKNQHAFCMNVDRGHDVRTLNNVKPTLRWLEVILHEFGHGIYELGYHKNLPWLLREPPHMITTEAMALLAGRQAYLYDSLGELIGQRKDLLRRKAADSMVRRQLIFSRWVLVMTSFERDLYRDPSQNLNVLWWKYVEKYQKIRAPHGREAQNDWAAKYHMGLAPVYYFSYQLGEMFASQIQNKLPAKIYSAETGAFLNEKLFSPGNSMSWDKLVEHVTQEPLAAQAWLQEFAV